MVQYQHSTVGGHVHKERNDMVFEREQYLAKLIAAKGNGFVKVVTGIRRCGKSYLLFTLFKNHLLASGINASHIVEIALDSDEFEELRDPRKLSSFVRTKVKRLRGPCYVLIDEIQMCEPVKSVVDGSSASITFYDVLNGLMKLPGIDLYLGFLLMSCSALLVASPTLPS